MPRHNLGFDAAVNGLTTGRPRTAVFAQRLLALLRAALHSETTPFGTAARTDAGLAAGHIPILGTGGVLSRNALPSATRAAAGAVRRGNAPQVSARLQAAAVTPAGLGGTTAGGSTATDAVAGAVRRATDAEAAADANVNAFVNPAQCFTVTRFRRGHGLTTTADGEDRVADLGTDITDFAMLLAVTADVDRIAHHTLLPVSLLRTADGQNGFRVADGALTELRCTLAENETLEMVELY